MNERTETRAYPRVRRRYSELFKFSKERALHRCDCSHRCRRQRRLERELVGGRKDERTDSVLGGPPGRIGGLRRPVELGLGRAIDSLERHSSGRRATASSPAVVCVSRRDHKTERPTDDRPSDPPTSVCPSVAATVSSPAFYLRNETAWASESLTPEFLLACCKYSHQRPQSKRQGGDH